MSNASVASFPRPPELYTLVAQFLATRQPTAAAAEVAALTQGPDLPAYVPSLFAGARDPTLADDPRLDYRDAAELRLLLDQLGLRRNP